MAKKDDDTYWAVSLTETDRGSRTTKMEAMHP